MPKVEYNINSDQIRELWSVDRLEVIDHKSNMGRVYSNRPCRVTLSLQDDGKTLKIFVDARK